MEGLKKPTCLLRCIVMLMVFVSPTVTTFLSHVASSVAVCRLWIRVSDAVVAADQHTATQEKFLIEEEQRRTARERKIKMVEWIPRLFEQNHITGEWVYKYAE